MNQREQLEAMIRKFYEDIYHSVDFEDKVRDKTKFYYRLLKEYRLRYKSFPDYGCDKGRQDS